MEQLPERLTEDVHALLAAARGQPGDVPAIVFASIGDDFFVVARHRATGDELLLSDVTAAAADDLARQVCAVLKVEVPGDDDMEDVWPVGELGIFDDLGMSAMEVGALLADLDAYADEQLLALARRLGFGEAFTNTVDVLVR